MNGSPASRPCHQGTREQREQALEQSATQLLVESLQTMGKGEYPFYSQSYLRRMITADERTLLDDEGSHVDAELPAAKIVWRLARKARLNSLETDVLRLSAAGEAPKDIARVLGITAGRARRLLTAAIEKMREVVSEVEVRVDEQIAQVLYEEQRRYACQKEKHCKPGQELCRRTGLCPKRWYLYQ